MNGNRNSAGLEPADSSNSLDHQRRRFEDAERYGRATQKAFETRGCWRLSREIDDEISRWQSEVEAARAAGEGERSSEGLHGENPPQAQVDQEDLVR